MAPAEVEVDSIQVLERLIGFETVFDRPNTDLIRFVADWLRGHGVLPVVMPSAAGTKANLWATIGAPGPGGICLSGHADVVPVGGQPWRNAPFHLTHERGRLYGRGSADMKGFLAVCLALVPEMVGTRLRAPIHLALTHDEEDGCQGAMRLIPEIGRSLPRPDLVIVGEPTSMAVVSGHKGMSRLRTLVTGKEAHSSRPDLGVSAVMIAGRLIAKLSGMAAALRDQADPASPFLPPYSTIHVGQVRGGIAPTIVARSCALTWDIRTLPEHDAALVVDQIEVWCRRHLLPEMQRVDRSTGIVTTTDFSLPGLRVAPDSRAETLARKLTGDRALRCVGYGTEAGLFQAAGIDAVLCGPGSIEQAHQPDEYVERDQIAACERFVRSLIGELRA